MQSSLLIESDMKNEKEDIHDKIMWVCDLPQLIN